jgi:hypothetical protein
VRETACERLHDGRGILTTNLKRPHFGTNAPVATTSLVKEKIVEWNCIWLFIDVEISAWII